MRSILATRAARFRSAIALALMLGVAACGQKGPLKLPVPPTPPGSVRPVPPATDPVQVSEPPSPGSGQAPFPPETTKP